MLIEYFSFLKLPSSKVRKLVALAIEIRNYKQNNEGAGLLAQIFGGKH